MKSYTLIPGTPAVSGTKTKNLYAAMEQDRNNTLPLTHWHEEAECITLLSGTLDFQINEALLTLHAGDTLLLFPQVIHRNGKETKGTALIRVLVNQEVMTSDMEIQSRIIRPFMENHSTGFLLIPATHPKAKELASLLMDIESSSKKEGLLGRLKVIALLHLLLYHLCLIAPPEEKSSSLASPSDRAVQKSMVDYIRSHYGDKISLDDIASAGKVSRSKCCSLFKTYMGSSPIDYVNDYRLGVSRTLLEYQDTPIADIAYACGFTSQSYFSKLFNRSFHMTPKEFRASCREG